MLRIQKIAKSFAKVKPLKLSVLSTDPNIKVKSLTNEHEWQVNNALQNLLASLIACETATLKDLCRRQKLKVNSIKFTKVESSYNLQNYIKGGADNKINEVTIDAQVETNGTQQQLNALHKKVENSCPVFQMIKGSGVKITNNWKNVLKKQ